MRFINNNTMELLFGLGYFAALAGLFLWKLLPQWSAAIPGGLEDTRLFLWNGWWFHYAASVLHTNPYHTVMLFHPFSANLISHDFPLWMNLITHLAQTSGMSLVGSSNLWFAMSWILAGFCTYGLAREVTGEPAVALVAGTIVMTHSYTLARAMQNWGQFNLYGIALFLWSLMRARRLGKPLPFKLAGVALAWTAACHFYFLIYSVLIVLAVAAYDLLPFGVAISLQRASRGLRRALCITLAAAAALVALMIWLNPGIHQVGAFTISMLSPENPVFVMWIAIIFALMTYVHAEFPDRPVDPERRRALLSGYALMIGMSAILLSPLLWESWKLIRTGAYPKQSILWKTHLPGANLLALFFANPIHALWGPAVSQWYASRGLQPQEQAAAIGWVCLVIVGWSKVWKTNVAARHWLALALAATIFSMGTHLHIAQYNLWCPLPFYILRLVPLLGNVRVPERWMAVGAISWSIVLALALLRLAAARGWSIRKLSFAAAALILIENWPGIPYASAPPALEIYQRLKELPEGAVLTVPLYIGDSSIGTGNAIGSQFLFPWDHLWAQVIHEKPIVGGYVGRISRRIIEAYKEDPFIHRLLDLEEYKIHTQDPEPAFGEYAVRNLKFRYVLLYRDSTDPESLKYVLGSLPLELVEKEGMIELYRIKADQSD